ncbi:MAG: DNA repair protein Rad50 [Dictyoglomaceae bacterium]|nr:DNA repair protein Rad50 [Dictyoglomaceae bacterium]
MLKVLDEVKNFQLWTNKNQNILERFINMLNEIKDLREGILIKNRKFQEEEEIVINLWEDITSFIKKNSIPLSLELLIFPNKEIGRQNLLWEILTWYLKVSKFITFSINFKNFPKLNSDFYYQGNKIYQPNIYYILEEEKNFLANLLISMSGFPSREGIKEFSLPQMIVVEKFCKDYFLLDSQYFNLIFYLS